MNVQNLVFRIHAVQLSSQDALAIAGELLAAASRALESSASVADDLRGPEPAPASAGDAPPPSTATR